jgi:hypothetical protein
MDDQTTMTTDTATADSPGSDSSLPAGHRKVESDDYEVTFHPAFASSCTVKKNGEETATDLYRQGSTYQDVVHCPEGHPQQHVIRIRGKGNGRDITITVHDPSHTLHSISFDLYKEARDRRVKPKSSAQVLGLADMQASADAADMQASDSASASTSSDVGETFTLENDAKTCPPHCDPVPEG